MIELFDSIPEIKDIGDANMLVKESVDGFLNLFNNSPACMSLTCPQRIFLKVNSRFLEIFGFSEDEIIGRNSGEIGILDPEEHVRVSSIIREKGRIRNEIIVCRTKERKLVYTISSIEMLEFNGKNYLVSSFLDITKIFDQQIIIEKQHQEILDSINYASLIQNSILPRKEQIEELFPNSFVLSKPKNIVSGDFHFFHKYNNSALIAAIDCTGHGVPGAFMSMLGFEKLCAAAMHSNDPSEILFLVNKGIITSLKQSDHENSLKDGMDIALCYVDPKTRVVKYAGANRPLWVIRKGTSEVEEIKATKNGIGGFTNMNQPFDANEIQLNEGDTFYLCTDGYADSFRGQTATIPDHISRKGKKLTTKKFKELLVSIQDRSMPQQKDYLNEFIENWRAETEQVDDILVIGIRL